MTKLIDLFKIALILCYVLCGCVLPMKTGYYTISEIRGKNTVVLREVQGDWHIPRADTLKVGQRIYLQRSKKDSLINVW